MDYKVLLYILVVLIITSIIGLVITSSKPPKSTELPSRQSTSAPQTKRNDQCTKQTCGALDPVSDPSYNMKNIIKQSILLEEHIAEENKYCKDCIVKHFLHIIGLSEEALWLACNKVDNYPYLEESVKFYNATFELWLANIDSIPTRREVLNKLRDQRKKLVMAYYLQ